MNKGTAIVGFILSFIAGMILIWGIDRSPGVSATPDTAAGADGAAGSKVAVNAGAVKVELFVMSQCPYGAEAETAFKDVVAKFGGDLDFRVEFIGQTSPSGELTSMHGAKEIKGDLVQVCAMKHAPAKWYEFIHCQNDKANGGFKAVDTNWEACAAQNGIDAGKLGACADGPEGKELLGASFKKATESGARGSPTILINGQKHAGGRKMPDLMKAICNAYAGAKPAACSDIPESPKVNVTILSDKRCTECNTQRLEGQIAQKVGAPVMKKLDYSEPEGKKIYDSIKPGLLPVALFDATLDADKDASAAFARGIKQAGDYKVMGGGSWNPACADAGGCDLDECKSAMQCRVEIPKKLEVFVMSQCPFGVKGMDAMKEVLDNFKKNKESIDFQIHFIGDGKGGSMHGQPEVDEDIREICAIHHYPKDYKYMDYIWCRNKNYKDANWQPCTGGETGIDTEVIKTCFEGGEGKKLLDASFAYSQSAGMSASPSWLANNKFKFSGVDAQTIKTQICEHNKLAGCDATLSGPPPRPAGAKGQPAAAPGCGG